MTPSGRHLGFTLEALSTEGPDARFVLVVENGVRFVLAGTEPPLIAAQSALDDEGHAVVQLLGRHDPREPWTMLHRSARL